MSDWVIWVAAVVVLLLAGYLAAARSRAAKRRRELATEMSRARRAISLAEASRDAYAGPLGDAEVMLAEATGLLSGNEDPATATRARELAEQADALWRGGSDDTQDAEPTE